MKSRCERCGEELDDSKIVWLELSIYTGRFTDPDKVDLGGSEDDGSESQGGFPFGAACAKAVLKAKGRCVAIGLRKKIG